MFCVVSDGEGCVEYRLFQRKEGGVKIEEWASDGEVLVFQEHHLKEFETFGQAWDWIGRRFV